MLFKALLRHNLQDHMAGGWDRLAYIPLVASRALLA